MSAAVEISAVATCPLRCSFCPQDKLGASYRGPEFLTLETLKKCLANLRDTDDVYFAGFTEPCLNPNIVEMIELVLLRGHASKLYTTGRGLRVQQAVQIAAMNLAAVVLHLPDASGNLGHSTGNVAILNELARHSNVRVMAMGEPHPEVAHLWDLPHVQSVMHSRAGNVSDSVSTLRVGRLNGPIRCRVAPDLDHWVILPDGSCALCCMDYSLQHIVGNLADHHIDEIKGGPALQAVREAQANDAEVLCRRCVCAAPA